MVRVDTGTPKIELSSGSQYTPPSESVRAPDRYGQGARVPNEQVGDHAHRGVEQILSVPTETSAEKLVVIYHELLVNTKIIHFNCVP